LGIGDTSYDAISFDGGMEEITVRVKFACGHCDGGRKIGYGVEKHEER
jgi:hypothetical protein